MKKNAVEVTEGDVTSFNQVHQYELRVGAIQYTVRLGTDLILNSGQSALGVLKQDNCRIYLDIGYNWQTLVHTFWHELLHIATVQSSLDKFIPEKTEEQLCDTFAYFIMDFLDASKILPMKSQYNFILGGYKNARETKVSSM